ncbi:hypothetical protein [Xanthomonas phage X1]|nr:hypothetical protein [Xanthomonas phage X1]
MVPAYHNGMETLFWLAVTFLGPLVLAFPPALKRLVNYYRWSKTVYVEDLIGYLFRTLWPTLIPAIGWFVMPGLYFEEFVEPILKIKLKG